MCSKACWLHHDLSPRGTANYVRRVWPAGGSLPSLEEGATSVCNPLPFLHGTALDAALASRLWLIRPWRQKAWMPLLPSSHIPYLPYSEPCTHPAVEAERADWLLFWLRAVTCFPSSVSLKLLPLSRCRSDARHPVAAPG